MLRALRMAWAACLLGFLGLLLVYYNRRVDPREAALYASDIRRLQSLHAQFETDVLELRSELVRHYDPANATVDELFRLHKTLARPPSFLPPDARAELSAKIAASEHLLEDTEERFEEFKQNNAQLRNSMRYVPTAANKVVERLQAQPDRERDAIEVKELLRAVLLYELLPDDGAKARVEQYVETVKAATRDASGDERGDVEALLRHVKTILRKKPQVEDSTKRIVAPIAIARAEELDATWVRHHAAALDAAQTRRTGLFVLAVATLMFAAAEIITRQRIAEAKLQDIMEKLERANVELEREREREKELSELKSRFVSMTSHEFRTPLSVIRSSAELLETYSDRWEKPKRTNHLRRIQTSVIEMSELLEGVLMVGRADAGTLAFEPTPIELKPFCAEVVEAVHETFPDAPPVRCRVNGCATTAALDERLMRYVLTNLLSNALKYSPQGGSIGLEVERREREVVFEVHDEGIGIPDADLPHLFDSFHRGRNVGDIPGTGLGLAVVKRLVDRQHGDIGVKTEEGSGTTFVVTIPLDERLDEGLGYVRGAVSIPLGDEGQ